MASQCLGRFMMNFSGDNWGGVGWGSIGAA